MSFAFRISEKRGSSSPSFRASPSSTPPSTPNPERSIPQSCSNPSTLTSSNVSVVLSSISLTSTTSTTSITSNTSNASTSPASSNHSSPLASPTLSPSSSSFLPKVSPSSTVRLIEKRRESWSKSKGGITSTSASSTTSPSFSPSSSLSFQSVPDLKAIWKQDQISTIRNDEFQNIEQELPVHSNSEEREMEEQSLQEKKTMMMEKTRKYSSTPEIRKSWEIYPEECIPSYFSVNIKLRERERERASGLLVSPRGILEEEEEKKKRKSEEKSRKLERNSDGSQKEQESKKLKDKRKVKDLVFLSSPTTNPPLSSSNTFSSPSLFGPPSSPPSSPNISSKSFFTPTNTFSSLTDQLLKLRKNLQSTILDLSPKTTVANSEETEVEQSSEELHEESESNIKPYKKGRKQKSLQNLNNSRERSISLDAQGGRVQTNNNQKAQSPQSKNRKQSSKSNGLGESDPEGCELRCTSSGVSTSSSGSSSSSSGGVGFILPSARSNSLSSPPRELPLSVTSNLNPDSDSINQHQSPKRRHQHVPSNENESHDHPHPLTTSQKGKRKSSKIVVGLSSSGSSANPLLISRHHSQGLQSSSWGSIPSSPTSSTSISSSPGFLGRIHFPFILPPSNSPTQRSDPSINTQKKKEEFHSVRIKDEKMKGHVLKTTKRKSTSGIEEEEEIEYERPHEIPDFENEDRVEKTRSDHTDFHHSIQRDNHSEQLENQKNIRSHKKISASVSETQIYLEKRSPLKNSDISNKQYLSEKEIKTDYQIDEERISDSQSIEEVTENQKVEALQDGSIDLSSSIKLDDSTLSLRTKDQPSTQTILSQRLKILQRDEIELSGGEIIKASTLDRLIYFICTWLISEKCSENIMNQLHSFIIWFPRYLTSVELMRKLIAIYQNIPEHENMQIAERIHKEQQKGVIRFLSRWLDPRVLEDFNFDEKTSLQYQQLFLFISRVQNDKYQTELMTKVQELELHYLSFVRKSSQPTVLEEKENGWFSRKLQLSKLGSVLDLNPSELAEQLAIVNFSNYSKITRAHWLNLGLAPEKDSPIKKMINHFNTVSSWVSSDIVSDPNINRRVAIIKRYLTVAESCLIIGDFEATMQILSGLNHQGVQRMKKTWKKIGAKSEQSFQYLIKKMDPSNAYRKYRKALDKSLENPSHSMIIPWIAVHVQDLILLEENPSYIGESQFINVEKFTLIGETIRKLLHIQKKYQIHLNSETTNERTLRQFIEQPQPLLDSSLIIKVSKKNEPDELN